MEETSTAGIRTTVRLFKQRLAGITVQLLAPSSSRELAVATTDDNGETFFDDLDPGTYDVALDLPSDYEVEGGDELRKSVTVADTVSDGITLDLILTVTDVEGYRYRTTRIGDQIWMAENLRVSRFRNGELIPEERADEDWIGAMLAETPAWSNYNNDPELGAAYGKLYNNYAAVDTRGICPEGWHVPSDDESKAMERSIGVPDAELDIIGWRGDVGGHLRSRKKSPAPHPRWTGRSVGATNATGFAMVGSGYRQGDPKNNFPEGSFNMLELEGAFYTATSAGSEQWGRSLVFDQDGVYRNSARGHGFAVRCLKD